MNSIVFLLLFGVSQQKNQIKSSYSFEYFYNLMSIALKMISGEVGNEKENLIISKNFHEIF